MNKEKLQEIGQLLLKRMDQVAIVVFLALLVAAGYVFLQEQNDQVPEIMLTNPAPFQNKVEGENLEEIQDQMIDTPEGIRNDPELRRVVQINMFDLKSVREASAQERQLREQFTTAERLAEEGNTQAAIRALNDILRVNPDFTQAAELKERLENPQPEPSEGGTETN
ncbi:MAG: hypothetical protein RLY93_10900 [Sumerlaeia bacterium]